MTIGIILELIGEYVSFVFGRFIVGLSIGYYSFITPLYCMHMAPNKVIVREISPKEIAGKLGSMFVLFVMSSQKSV